VDPFFSTSSGTSGCPSRRAIDAPELLIYGTFRLVTRLEATEDLGKRFASVPFIQKTGKQFATIQIQVADRRQGEPVLSTQRIPLRTSLGLLPGRPVPAGAGKMPEINSQCSSVNSKRAIGDGPPWRETYVSQQITDHRRISKRRFETEPSIFIA
jgi:hypothetical protein